MNERGLKQAITEPIHEMSQSAREGF